MTGSVSSVGKVTVCYLARGADDHAIGKMAAFAASYTAFTSGCAHELAVIYKGYRNASALQAASAIFEGLAARNFYIHDRSFDLGAYFAAASRLECDTICFLNTGSEILADDWLAKLAVNLGNPGVGIVGCSGSYEGPAYSDSSGIAFPNPHLRSNAFMIDRRCFLSMRPQRPLREKTDLYLLEHGPESITRQIAKRGLKVLVVGRNGRGYEPVSWPISRTFRQGSQDNLLVGDNRSREYETAPIPYKKVLFALAWGNGEVIPKDLVLTKLGTDVIAPYNSLAKVRKTNRGRLNETQFVGIKDAAHS